MKRRRTIVFLTALCILFCGCGGSYAAGSCSARLMQALTEVQGLPPVFFYSSLSEEGEAGYMDPALPAALLGKEDKIPDELSDCEELSFFCSSDMRVCEGWVAVCRNYGAAMSMEKLFLSRKEFLLRVNYESDADLSAAGQAICLRRGKTVWFFALPHADEMLAFLFD